MTHTPTLSRRQEMYAWAARAGAATVISNLGLDHAVWYFFTAQLMRATVILNSNSLSGKLFRGEDNDLTACALRGANVLLNYAIPGGTLLSGSAF